MPSHGNVQVREFNFYKNNEINLIYHYGEGHYSQETRTFIKPAVSERGKHFKFNAEMTFSYKVTNAAFFKLFFKET